MKPDQLIAKIVDHCGIDADLQDRLWEIYSPRMLVGGSSGLDVRQLMKSGRSVMGLSDIELANMRGSLELAVRLGAEGPQGFGYLAYPRPEKLLSQSLAAAWDTVKELMQACEISQTAQQQLWQLQQLAFPGSDTLDWLSPTARACMMALGFGPGVPRPLCKVYYNTRLDPGRYHAEKLVGMLEILGYEGSELLVGWDEALGQVSIKRGVGLDLFAGSDLRFKYYCWLRSWDDFSKVRETLQTYGPLVNQQRLDMFVEHFQWRMGSGMVREVELALAKAGPDADWELKINVLFSPSEPGAAQKVREYLVAIGWDAAAFEELHALVVAQLGTEGEVLHGLAAGMAVSDQHGPLNLYFLERALVSQVS